MNSAHHKRLVHIRYVFACGSDLSLRPEPTNAPGLLLLHDSAELMLGFVAERLNFAQPTSFMDYWDAAQRSASIELPHKEPMRRVNKARVAFKHHGLLPSRLDLEEFRVTVLMFLKETAEALFQIDFASVRTSDLIPLSAVRRHLRLALAYSGKQDFTSSAQHFAIAFNKLLDSYEKTKRYWHQSPFHVGGDMTFLSSFHIGFSGSENSEQERRLGRFVDAVKDSIEKIQPVVRILGLGLDYRKYARFRMMTPHVTRVIGGRLVVHQPGTPPDFQYTSEELDFLETFITESALSLFAVDYTTSDYLTRLGRR